MKKFILSIILFMVVLPLSTYSRDNTKGVYLDGMYSTHLLASTFDSSNNIHTLSTAATTAPEYEDRVLLFSFLTENNDGTTIDATKNYSDAGLGRTAFVIKPLPGEVYRLSRLIVSYKDNGSFDSGTYGNGLVLTNGIAAWFRKDGVDVIPAFKPPFMIMTNPDWATICYDVRVDDYGLGDGQLTARFTFLNTSKFMELVGDEGDEFAIYFNDNFTTLNSHRFMVQGYYEVGPLP